jgi:hypothetical protein
MPGNIETFRILNELQIVYRLMLRSKAGSQKSAERDLAYFLDYLFRLQAAVRMVPAREPEDRA